MFIGVAEEEVDVRVEFEVPFVDAEEVRAPPERTIWEGLVVVWEDVPVVLLAVIIDVPTPNNVVDPSVVVRIEEPLLIVETMAEVVTGEVDCLVIVEEYEI